MKSLLKNTQVQVILVGDIDAVRDAIRLPPKAFSRQVGLKALLEAELQTGDSEIS